MQQDVWNKVAVNEDAEENALRKRHVESVESVESEENQENVKRVHHQHE